MGTVETGSERVAQALRSRGHSGEVISTPSSTGTVAQAAVTLGCTESQIVKSLVLRGGTSGRPYLVLASGTNRLDTARLAEAVGEPLSMADADFVRRVTGYSIGGVPPLGHLSEIETFIDEDLLELEVMYAAAGSPFHVFALTPAELHDVVRGRVLCVKNTTAKR
jgi:prolyl-tRNA editing enzyme YbaK/EbsC (Cys-tRNA(Pro) deacylase)